MKRYLFIILCLLLVGCTKKTPTAISLNTAKSIALQQYPNCETISIVRNSYGCAPHYIISLSDHENLYVVQVDLYNGQLTQNSHQTIQNTYTNLSINVAKAKELALNYHNGELVDFYLTEINYLPYYKATINDGTYTYILAIDALTSEITELEHNIIQN